MLNGRRRKTVEQKYLEPAILVANRIFHAREFATSYSFSVEANGNSTVLLSSFLLEIIHTTAFRIMGDCGSVSLDNKGWR